VWRLIILFIRGCIIALINIVRRYAAAPPPPRIISRRLPYGMAEAYKFSNAKQGRASESNLEFYSQRSLLSRFHNVPIAAAHARSPSLAQRAAARSCRPLGWCVSHPRFSPFFSILSLGSAKDRPITDTDA